MDTKTVLGEKVGYTATYTPDLLFPVARRQNREKIDITSPLPFTGEDIWNAYELSWLESGGKPRVAMGEIRFSPYSVNIIESKSLKLYLNSFNQSNFTSPEEVVRIMETDLQRVAQGEVSVTLILAEDFSKCGFAQPEGFCLDDLEIETDRYTHHPGFLSAAQPKVTECLYSNLLRSTCPVTGQPDWGTLVVSYSGPRIVREGLLRYIISFREHTGFHENCVELIFADLLARCAPLKLAVYARFTRRGGLDINPFRTTPGHFEVPQNIRFARQ